MCNPVKKLKLSGVVPNKERFHTKILDVEWVHAYKIPLINPDLILT